MHWHLQACKPDWPALSMPLNVTVCSSGKWTILLNVVHWLLRILRVNGLRSLSALRLIANVSYGLFAMNGAAMLSLQDVVASCCIWYEYRSTKTVNWCLAQNHSMGEVKPHKRPFTSFTGLANACRRYSAGQFSVTQSSCRRFPRNPRDIF